MEARALQIHPDDDVAVLLSPAIAAGTLDPRRLDAMARLVAEELALEEEQRAHVKAGDRRGMRKPRPR